MSPNEKGTIYIGAQFVFRSRDHGQSWERISPDLTTNDPEKQKQEESGGVTVDNSVGRDAHDHLLHLRIAQERADHLGGHRRRQRAGHARRRQDIGPTLSVTFRAWARRRGSPGWRPAASPKARLTPPSTATCTAT